MKICWFVAIIYIMTDKEILESLQKVLDKIHNQTTGAFRNAQKWVNGLTITRMAITKGIPAYDVRFSISGKEFYEKKLGDLASCTGMTKLFLYAAQNSGLDLKAVITTEIDCLNAGKSNIGHVVPAVKMSDGKYHIFEPRCHNVMRHDFQKMLKQSVEIGKPVFHILNSIKDKPYEVIDIIDAVQLEQIKTMQDIIQKSRRKVFVPEYSKDRD